MTDAPGTLDLQLSDDGRVATILLDRTAKLNALTLPLLERLIALCDEVERSSARVVLIRTAGDRAFCVGADIGHFAALSSSAEWANWIATGHRAFDRLGELSQPTVAVVDGSAFGGGLELALACDLRVVSTSARLGLPEAGLGTVPGWGGTARLPVAVGRARALELMLTRRALSADEAADWGLATRIAAPADLEGEVAALVGDLLGSAPLASRLIKQITATGDAAVLESLAGALAAGSADLREGIAAFHERRTPTFTGA